MKTLDADEIKIHLIYLLGNKVGNTGESCGLSQQKSNIHSSENPYS